jgi:holliday junction DNA helicase RuvB
MAQNSQDLLQKQKEKKRAVIEHVFSPKANESERLDESDLHNSNRPITFDDYPGQDRAKNNLKVYVEAAHLRKQPLDHVLLHGPPGLGKTTLARIIAKELDVQFIQTSGPSIEKPGDLAGVLSGVERGGVLFIDEIHRLSTVVEEVLYSAMEDFAIDIIVGQGAMARSVRMPIEPFTLIGATTRVSLLTRPLLGRFGIQERLEFYEDASLVEIISRTAKLECVPLAGGAAQCLAQRSRGTPRTANRLFRRVRDFSLVSGAGEVGAQCVNSALTSMDIDPLGLEPIDRLILTTIYERYNGGPVGVETLSHTIGEDKSTIEDVYEPFLVYKGFLQRGPRGREITARGIDHVTATK